MIDPWSVEGRQEAEEELLRITERLAIVAGIARGPELVEMSIKKQELMMRYAQSLNNYLNALSAIVSHNNIV